MGRSYIRCALLRGASKHKKRFYQRSAQRMRERSARMTYRRHGRVAGLHDHSLKNLYSSTTQQTQTDGQNTTNKYN